MRIVLTKHADEKLRSKEAVLLRINEDKIKEVFESPIIDDRNRSPHLVIGKLDETLSLCVIYKLEKRAYKVITFYPSQKGRYESKVLRRR